MSDFPQPGDTLIIGGVKYCCPGSPASQNRPHPGCHTWAVADHPHLLHLELLLTDDQARRVRADAERLAELESFIALLGKAMMDSPLPVNNGS